MSSLSLRPPTPYFTPSTVSVASSYMALKIERPAVSLRKSMVPNAGKMENLRVMRPFERTSVSSVVSSVT